MFCDCIGGDIIESKFVPNYFVKNIFRADNKLEGFNENHLLLLVHLQEYATIKGDINFCFSFMFDKLNITYYELKKELYQCLVDLDNWGLIEITNKFDIINQNTNIFIEKIQYDNEFTMLIADEIDKILYCNEDIRLKRTLLYIYTIIVSWIGINGREYCFPTRDQFKMDIQTKSNKRIEGCICKLKELGLIDYANAGVVKSDNNIYQANNIYVLTSNKDYKEILKQAIDESRFYYENINR